MSNILKQCLLIGINYEKTQFKLNGCINDSNNIKQFLINNKYFTESQIIMMNDNQKGELYPTKSNIIKQLNNLLNMALKNTKKKIYYFLAYSGHGSNLPDTDKDEDDGFDECLCPIDCQTKGFITDDYIRKEFINKLPKEVNLVTLIDACHSGTILDLKYNYAIDKKNSYKTVGVYENSKCNVVMISGCKDNQTSADAFLPTAIKKDSKKTIENFDGGCGYEKCTCGKPSIFKKNSDDTFKLKNMTPMEYSGAMTSAFLAVYNPLLTYEQLITNIRVWLVNNNFTQIPQLSSGNIIDTKSKFLLTLYK